MVDAKSLPPLPESIPLGWTVTSLDHCAYLLHPDSALPYLTKYLHVDKELVANLLLYIAANCHAVLTSSSLPETPIDVLRVVVACPTLSIDEDELLSHMFRYAAILASVEPDNPEYWSETEISVVSPILADLVPSIALLSLSSTSCVQLVEPLGLVPTAALAKKYKYDVFLADARACGRSERDMVLERYGGSAICGKTGDMLWARQSAVISESAHPYETGAEEDLESVAVAGWAGFTGIEFDRRSCIGLDARLSFYGDENGRIVLGEWKHLWRKGGTNPSGNKFWVIPGNKFWVGFKCPPKAKALWGWKLRACPLLDDIDTE
jgi:hypothetical protein